MIDAAVLLGALDAFMTVARRVTAAMPDGKEQFANLAVLAVNIAKTAMRVGVSLCLDPSLPLRAKTERTARMRTAKRGRRQKGEEALIATIKTLRGDGPVAHPTKEANVILDGTNQQLKLDGFDPVSADVIRRRLEKFPRS